jgi:hypothetical protein
MIKTDAAGVMGFLQSNLAYVEQQLYQTEYTEPLYKNAFASGAIDTSAGWARTVEVYSIDMVGMGKFLSGNALDIPIADIGFKRGVSPIESAGIGYRYTYEELMTAQYASANGSVVPGQALDASRAMVCRTAFEQHVDMVALTGDTDKGYEGLFNNSNVPTANVINGASATPGWETKTADEILFDINDAINDVFAQTKNIDKANTLALPSSAFQLIAGMRLGTVNDTTVLEFIRSKNVYTAMTNSPLEIVPFLHLETIGAGSTKRMIAYNKNPIKQKMHVPVPLQFLAPQLKGYEYQVPGIYRLGPAEWRYPLSGVYRDGI